MKLPTWAEAMYNVVDFGSHGDYKAAELWLAIARELREGAEPSLLPGKAAQDICYCDGAGRHIRGVNCVDVGPERYMVAGEPWEPGSTPSYRQYEWAKFARKQMDEYPGVPRLAIEVTAVQDIIESYDRHISSDLAERPYIWGPPWERITKEEYERRIAEQFIRVHPFRGHDGAPCLEVIGDTFCDRPEGDPAHAYEDEV